MGDQGQMNIGSLSPDGLVNLSLGSEPPPLGLALSYEVGTWLHVNRILPGAPAARAGVCIGDVIVAINAEDVTAATQERVDVLFTQRPLELVVRRNAGKSGAGECAAFLVRTCRPTDAMVQRMLHWAQELGDGVDFFISIDETSETARSTAPRIDAARVALGIENDRVHIHRYTEAELEEEYPALLELREKLPNGARDIPGKSGLRSMAWMFHSEPLGHWLRSLDDKKKYSFVWVLEDDVGYSGSIDGLVNAYAADPHDLISGRWIATPVPREPPQGPHFYGGWYWYYDITAAFEKRVSPDRRMITEEHVQRISMRLLEEIDRWAHEGCSTVSEQLVPTVAYVNGMMLKPLREEHIGDPFHCETQVGAEDWARILETAEKPGRCYHALKF